MTEQKPPEKGNKSILHGFTHKKAVLVSQNGQKRPKTAENSCFSEYNGVFARFLSILRFRSSMTDQKPPGKGNKSIVHGFTHKMTGLVNQNGQKWLKTAENSPFSE